MAEENFHKQSTNPGADQAAAPEQPAIPEFIENYKIESLLDRGGMSYIYLGIHPDTKDAVIIKVLSPKYLGHPDVVDRFIAEAEIIGLADHPNIVKLYGQGKWEGGLYIAMEYIQGVSLRQYLQYTPLSLRRALEIVIEVAYALCHLHTHGVIHRDLKLENILVTETGAIKVIDFGIAQLLKDRSEMGISPRQRLVGTPVYMSPEQREDPENVSYPSDIYSLGIITYELVLGRLSHGQVHLGLMPKGLQKILAKTLQPRPEDRYQDVVDFITDISAYINSAALQKDRKEGDLASEFSEQLQHAQMNLVPLSAPVWSGMSVGVAYHKGMTIAGVYYDFFSLGQNVHAVVMAESTMKGVGGVVSTAMLRGMIRSLCRLTTSPKQLIDVLNELLVNDAGDQVFTISYLMLDLDKNKFHYISCGYGNLWKVVAGDTIPQKITSENVALGIDRHAEFVETTEDWNPGDLLVLNSLANISSAEQTGKEFNQDHFKAVLTENLNMPPQKIVEAIMRKAKAYASKAFDEQSLAISAILRGS
jgi:serine/threonine protein kinase